MDKGGAVQGALRVVGPDSVQTVKFQSDRTFSSANTSEKTTIGALVSFIDQLMTRPVTPIISRCQ